MGKTKISWTDETWNPVTGCSKVSPGCQNCYAERQALGRLKGFKGYPGLPWTHANAKTNVVLHPIRLAAPLRRRKPTTYFVNSMSDLFHEEVPDEFIDRVFGVMALAAEHTFQILTKRAGRMHEYLASDGRSFNVEQSGWSLEIDGGSYSRPVELPSWPLPNVWVGVSVEDQKRADERIPLLLHTHDAVRFLSVEPLLGPVDLSVALEGTDYNRIHPCKPVEWVIVGGESGPGARPMHPDWCRSIRDKCVEAGVAFFFKQWGEWLPHGQLPATVHRDPIQTSFGALDPGGTFLEGTTTWNGRKQGEDPSGEWAMTRIGKKAAGRELDGRTWDEMPAVWTEEMIAEAEAEAARLKERFGCSK